ncbi:MAG TPA: (5-formylfuran-3-yl)methyl phosphate synthase, partial [Methyloceanibacter sp.]|nr:(5-formylfuran-3-yl)methyl phosphate synthase [Methyloceanibacter sp.]
MTRFLASVRDAGEAEAALAADADIIDLKDPAKGALGALTPEGIASCVAAIAGRAAVSATVGDLPMEPDTVRSAALATAAMGVDYVKLGLFPGGDARGCLDLLAEEARG